MNILLWSISINVVSVCLEISGALVKRHLLLALPLLVVPKQFTLAALPWKEDGTNVSMQRVLLVSRKHFSCAGKDTTKPNILMGANAQVALEYVPLQKLMVLMTGNSLAILKLRHESFQFARSPNIVLISRKFVRTLMKIQLVEHIYFILRLNIRYFCYPWLDLYRSLWARWGGC